MSDVRVPRSTGYHVRDDAAVAALRAFRLRVICKATIPIRMDDGTNSTLFARKETGKAVSFVSVVPATRRNPKI